MRDDTRDVADFFGRIADEYGRKYETGDAFHHYFFNERLDEAVVSHDFSGCRVLDVGAGTGSLFERIVRDHPSVDYYAVDISEGMLVLSTIPAERRFVGTLSDVRLPLDQFDFVFFLGVSTYMSDDDLTETLERFRSLLVPGGRAIVTFTNRRSADWKMRRLIRKVPGIRSQKRFVISQEFPTYARSMEEIENLTKESFVVERVVGLNHTVFPINQLLKGPSVSTAKRIHKRSFSGKRMLLSSDILVEMRTK